MDKKYKVMVIGSIVLIIFLIFIMNFNFIGNKSFDVDAIREQSLRYYEEDDTRPMDFMDMTALFGIDLSESKNSVFLSNVSAQDEITVDTIMIAVINSDVPEYYYDIFRSYLDSNLINIEDSELLELYNNAILKKGDGYVYFIFSDDALVIEKDINTQFK